NITPSSGAPARPAFGRAEGRAMRPANENRSNAPANSSPSRMVSPPRTWVSTRACPVSRCPSPPRAAPYAMNTTEKPSTNSAVPATTRPRGETAAVAASGGVATATPDAGVPDAGVPEAGVPEAGVPEAGAPDAGAPAADPGAAGTEPGAAGDAGPPAPA